MELSELFSALKDGKITIELKLDHNHTVMLQHELTQKRVATREPNTDAQTSSGDELRKASEQRFDRHCSNILSAIKNGDTDALERSKKFAKCAAMLLAKHAPES